MTSPEHPPSPDPRRRPIKLAASECTTRLRVRAITDSHTPPSTNTALPPLNALRGVAASAVGGAVSGFQDLPLPALFCWVR